jgi:uracil-DNA glycosylase
METKNGPKRTASCTANGVFKYDHPFNTIPLSDWVQAITCVNGWKALSLQPGAFSYDNMCMSIGRLFQKLTFDVEAASDIIHEAWIENYTYWVTNKPWKNSPVVYKKPKNEELCEKYTTTKYADLPDDEKEKNRAIACYIINNHLDYQQFVKSFTPSKLEELEDKTLIFPPSSNPLSIQPTIIINESNKSILKRTINSYKISTDNAPIYDFTTTGPKLYLGPTSQVALTSQFRGKLAGSRGVVISIEDVDGEELPLVHFLDGDKAHVKYMNGVMPLMMANYVALTSDIKFELEMCLIDGNLIDIDMIGRALEKARTFDCVEVKNMPSWTPETVLDLISDPVWKQILREAFATERRTEFLETFSSWVWSQYDTTTVFPPKHEIFAALNAATFDDVKVVIIGQDPYHTPKKAHGLSFSVRNGIQPSLRNIYAELQRTGFTVPTKSGNLMKWAKQGVLLLNSSLTVCSGKANSHVGKGWEKITDEIIHQISSRKDSVVFMLWGAFAKKKCELIDVNKHCVLKAVHPSPMATGYIGCNCFRDANNYLISKGRDQIDWNLNDDDI